MGDFRVRPINDDYDRHSMYIHAIDDVEAFEKMLASSSISEGPIHVGAEQELCLIDQQLDPSTVALEFLDRINDDHYTNELALFNLEINADAYAFSDFCFSQMQESVSKMLDKGQDLAGSFDSAIYMCGILPTLQYRHLQFEYMTPIKRYQTLSKTLHDLRGQNFEIYLQGTDELIMSLSSVLFEACNTSFQMHLQIKPGEFVNKHNWSQMIAGPVLSTAVNSPLLFANELWHETRIALFKQSLDTRSSLKFMRRKLPRVYFGNDWIRNSASDLWRNDLMRFPLIVTSDDFNSSTKQLENGEIPELRAIKLHNGTTYTWNRLCYGTGGNKPHLRIECRYMPAGPSLEDEFANFAFWTGLMNNTGEYGDDFWKAEDFRTAKSNFVRAARTGFNTVFSWFGKNITAQKLILDILLEQSAGGLKKAGVNDRDINRYLKTIEKRALKEITGSEWMIQNFRNLSRKNSDISSVKTLVKQSLAFQKNNVPVHEWDMLKQNLYIINPEEERVEEYMSKDIFSVHKNDSIEIVRKIMEWNKIHHLPVENKEGDLIGMITDGIVERLDESKSTQVNFASQIMIVNPVTVKAEDSLSDARNLMKDHNISGLPVTYQNKLVGIITVRDCFIKEIP